jgi:hypothetical protein
MGSTVNSVHVYVGDDGPDDATAVADAVTVPALVTPPDGGWVTVYPASEALGDDALAGSLSRQLGRPCVSYFCMDSDIAAATLVVRGAAVDRLVFARPDRYEEMTGGPPVGAPVPGVDSDVAVFGDLGVWLTTLGVGDRDEIVDGANDDPETPFADDVATAVLAGFGLASHRLGTAYRFFERDDDAEEIATFLRIG